MLHQIAPHVGRVLANLANDSGQWSRQLLQNVVDILSATVDGHVDALKGEAQDMFKDKYDDVVSTPSITYMFCDPTSILDKLPSRQWIEGQ